MSARTTPASSSPLRDFEMDSKDRDTLISPGSERQMSESSMQEDIARLAYSLWQSHGCPQGSAETDWFEAEQKLLQSTERTTATATRRS